MSGHSKWANIKNRKGAQDKKRSEAFTKSAKDILIAIRGSGGNTNPESNAALRAAIERARTVNMPRENIERLIARFESRRANLMRLTLEGYGQGGVPLMIEAETDNKNRTMAEIRSIFRNYGSELGETNSVGFMFEKVGEIETGKITEEQELKLIDLGVIDFGDGSVYTKPEELAEIKERIEEEGIETRRGELVMRCKQPVLLKDEEMVAKVLDFIDELEGHDDVVGVFSGFDYHG